MNLVHVNREYRGWCGTVARDETAASRESGYGGFGKVEIGEKCRMYSKRKYSKNMDRNPIFRHIYMISGGRLESSWWGVVHIYRTIYRYRTRQWRLMNGDGPSGWYSAVQNGRAGFKKWACCCFKPILARLIASRARIQRAWFVPALLRNHGPVEMLRWCHMNCLRMGDLLDVRIKYIYRYIYKNIKWRFLGRINYLFFYF